MADLLTQFGFTSSLFDAIKEVKTSGNVAEEKKVDPKLDALHKRAQDTSKEHGVVKHINKNDHDNGHHVSDFYDDDKTVATYNKGKLKEEVEKKPSTVNMSHQGKTTLNHIKNPTVQQRMLAHDIKPGIKGYRDRIALLRTGKESGNLKKEDMDTTDFKINKDGRKVRAHRIVMTNKVAKDIKPDIEESFSPAQIATLKAEYSKINGIDPSQPTYKKLIAMLDKLDLASLKSLAGADIKFVSMLAKNRVTRKSVKEEVEKLDETHVAINSKTGKVDFVGDKKSRDEFIKSKNGLHQPGQTTGNQRKVGDKWMREEVEKKPSTVNMSHQGKTTLNHIKNPTVQQRMAAHDIKPGIKGYRDRIDLLRDAEHKKNLKKEEVEELDELSKDTLKSYAKKAVGDLHKQGVKQNDQKATARYKGLHKAVDKLSEEDVEEELKGDQHKLDKNKNGKLDAEDFKKVRKSVAEGIMDKIKAVKRGMEAKAKAADHFDKASEPSNPNKSKDLKRAVKYHNLVNKEETEIEEEVKDEYGRKVDKYLKKKYGSDDSKKKEPQGAEAAEKRRKERLASNGRMDEEVKVGDKVSFDHPMKAIPGKTMKKVGTVHKVEDDTVHIKVKDKYGVITHKKSASELTKEEFESIDEAPKYDNKYTIYHKDYSSAVQHAAVHAGKQGYEIDHDDWDRVVAMGPKKPSAGKTNILNVSLKKNGVETKKKLHMQVYNMDNKGYELNTYVEEVQLDELNKDTLHSYAKKAEVDQDKQFTKVGKAIRDYDPKAANAAGHKFSMRSIGQNRAEKRLSKEEVSVNEAAKQPTKRFKDMKKKNTAGTKSEEGSSKKGEPLSGKKEPIEVNPEFHKNQK